MQTSVFSAVASLIASIGFYKTMLHIQSAYEENNLPFHKAKGIVEYMQDLYLKVGNSRIPEWLHLQ